MTSTADAPYYDFSSAYDAYDKQAVTPSTHSLVQDTSLQHGHGSTVADFIIQGIQATEAQPGAGGVDVKIMPIRDTPPNSNNPDNNSIVRGVYWAVDHGASVINLSLRVWANQPNQDILDTDPADTQYYTLSGAIRYAEQHNVVVVTASGNETVSVDQQGQYGTHIMPGAAD